MRGQRCWPSCNRRFDSKGQHVRWDAYQRAFEIVLKGCPTEATPWYVVPAERRWFRDLVISQLLHDTLADMNPQYPPPTFDPADYPPSVID